MIKLGVITSLNANVEENIRRVAELGLPTCQRLLVRLGRYGLLEFL